MSDSHDNLDAIRKAVRFFNSRQCELVIHAGDFIAPFAAKELVRLSCGINSVFGNCDGEKAGLAEIIASFGMIQNEPFAFNYGRRKFLLTHTHWANEEHIRTGKYDVLIYGHTHKPDIRKVGGTLVVNPGETGGWLTGKNSVAILDSASLEADIIVL